MSVIAWNCRGLGSSLVVRTLTEEVRAKDPLLVFLLEMKAGVSRIKGIQNKIDFRQGITIPSDGQSGGLALLWREGTNVRFKSYSNSHINVEIHENSSLTSWHAIGFYEQPDAAKRFSPWQLLEVLKGQSQLSWVVFSDFNEITHFGKNLGGPKRDVGQVREFRECLSRFGLNDLGFVGQRYTWCNRRYGEHRTKLRLDRIVASMSWIERFPKASVHHFAMSISNHCLLMLFLDQRQRCKLVIKYFSLRPYGQGRKVLGR